jgi:hypothetical protein
LTLNIRILHRASAMLIAPFVLVHLANHLASLASIAAHLRFMDTARLVYRQPVIEALLLAAVAFQGASGSWLAISRWRQRRGAVAWLQAGSGIYLILFLLNHVGAVLFGRLGLGLDTNFYFAAAGLHVAPFQYFFAPYYFLSVVALFTHLGCALYWAGPAPWRQRTATVALPAMAGAVISLLLVMSLAGRIQPFETPVRYLQTYVRAGA